MTDFLELAISNGGEVSGLDLDQLEIVIERGQQTFIEVGRALMEIRDRRLYRETHATFEAYCNERWGWSRQRANQLVDAAHVAGTLTTGVVTTEAQARAMLAHLDPEEREQVRSGNATPETVERMTASKPKTPKDTRWGDAMAGQALASIRDRFAGTAPYWQPVWDAIDELNAKKKAERQPDTSNNTPRHTADPGTPAPRSRRLPRKKADKMLPHFLTTLSGMAAGLAGVDFSECVLEPYQIKELDTSMRAILSVRRTLKGANT